MIGTGAHAAHSRAAEFVGKQRMAKSKHKRPSWDGRDTFGHAVSPTVREALETMSAHRLVVSFVGYAAVLKDIAECLAEGDEKTDVLYVADRIERTVPALEEAMRKYTDVPRPKRKTFPKAP